MLRSISTLTTEQVETLQNGALEIQTCELRPQLHAASSVVGAGTASDATDSLLMSVPLVASSASCEEAAFAPVDGVPALCGLR